jgi:Putative porin
MLPARTLAVGALLAAVAPSAAAQSGAWKGFQLKWEGLARQEWTDKLAFQPTPNRWMLQLRPVIEFANEKVHLGVGGDFIYSQDKNYDPTPVVMRDNYKSRDARVDLAFLRLKPASWLTLEGGRFEMPLPVTEMIWDRDLRAQGGAATITWSNQQGEPRLAVIGAWTKGSHVFDDQDTTLAAGSVALTLRRGPMTRFELAGSYLRFDGLASLAPMLRRQNTRVAGVLVKQYEVVDLVARFRHEGAVMTQLVAEYGWNTRVDQDKKGVWLAAIFGSTVSARVCLEYSYAYVERDATLGAYSADDFLWTTAWEHHKGDLGFRAGHKASLHVVGQVQRFLSAATQAAREQWYARWRVELRMHN